MLWNEALERLKKGDLVGRKGWEGVKYLAIMPGMTTIWQMLTKPNPTAGNWLPFVSDYEATDWDLVEKEYENPELQLKEEVEVEKKEEEVVEAA